MKIENLRLNFEVKKEFGRPHTEGTPIWSHCLTPKSQGQQSQGNQGK